jgi:hypothetical protein
MDFCRRPGGIGESLRGVAALLVFVALAGCVETASDLAPSQEAMRTQLVRREGFAISGATVAFVSIDGPPGAISAQFSRALAREASSRDIKIADAKSARYFIRGYLSASSTKDGAVVAYVWDVFDRNKDRAQRVSDSLQVNGDNSDPWRIVGEAALDSVAAKSADDLAAFLSYTPEAVAVAASAQTPAPDAKTLSYAPAE